MKILVVEPEKKLYAREISGDIHEMQEVVDGLIEPIRFEPENDAVAFCNEEFLFNGSRPNRLVVCERKLHDFIRRCDFKNRR